MATRKEREEAARKAREEALKFLEAHPDGIAVSSIPQSLQQQKSRDNTLEFLRSLKDQKEALVAKPAEAAPPVREFKKAAVPEGWSVDGVYSIHSLTGCAVRSRDPAIIEGGIAVARPPPKGWKIIQASGANIIQRYFYWNAQTGETSWVYPGRTNVSVVDIVPPQPSSSSSQHHAVQDHPGAENVSAPPPEEAVQLETSTTSTVSLEQRTQKKAKIASIFNA